MHVIETHLATKDISYIVSTAIATSLPDTCGGGGALEG